MLPKLSKLSREVLGTKKNGHLCLLLDVPLRAGLTLFRCFSVSLLAFTLRQTTNSYYSMFCTLVKCILEIGDNYFFAFVVPAAWIFSSNGS
jgi:hypothetical protein